MNRRLRMKILEKFDNQANFAMAVQVDESLVSRIVRRRKRLTLEDQEKWADALDCLPHEIFEEGQNDDG